MKILGVSLVLFILIPRYALAIQLGLLSGEALETELTAQWDEAIGGSTLQFVSDIGPENLVDRQAMPLIVLEDECLETTHQEALANWVRSGGILLINGIECIRDFQTERDSARAGLAGLLIGPRDESILGVYPRVTSDTPLLAPFESDDGLRLGEDGIGHPYPVEADAARVLSRGYRIEPGPGKMIRSSQVVTMASHRIGDGLILYLNFSLGRIAACYPDTRSGAVTDCSAAGTARGLMRNLIANLLWEQSGIQVPLRWETPGNRPVGVVITGDVHADSESFQIRSARTLADSLSGFGVPISYYVVGEVAERFPQHYQALEDFPDVSINGHSAHGDQYRDGRLAGTKTIVEDLRKAESMLGIPSWPESRMWLRAIRTEAWASNESEAGAWTAMEEAGVALVMDHNADAVLPEPSISAPLAWFEGAVNRRLFMPMLESSVHTEDDDFRLGAGLKGNIFSIGSPEPDPCCNNAVRFSIYADYVRRWHREFLKMGLVGGATEVWLWHPSTPVWKGGLDELANIVSAMASDRRVRFLSADELAVWAYNRARMRVKPQWGTDGYLTDLELVVDYNELVPDPPQSSGSGSKAAYWVFGDAELPEWSSRQWRDGYGRTVTVLTRPAISESATQ